MKPSSVPTFFFVQPASSARPRLHLCGSLFVSIVIGFATSTCSHAVAHLTFSLLLALPTGLPTISASTARRVPSSVYRSMQPKSRRVREVTLEFWGFTASAVGANSSLLEITRLICASFGITRLICASFGITRLICASFGITRLICASFRITRLICASFGITRLICASDDITRLIDVCVLQNHWTVYVGKGMARGRPARGKKDA
ncbi:hypothetical protein E6C27_scaffold191G001020 [Cucumis melo var. makuwa]|uniref:Uncharacterized protein n=1 Tax=Cucumis melo var. makuwa TaxID=1194695 RepID=A0A5A7T3D3_CUCMM|nr:hypothetical protein E6C27_scaffold191G001020 [Cucumis melo var. makuwa]